MALRFDPHTGRFVEVSDEWGGRMGDARAAYASAQRGDSAAANPWASRMGDARSAYTNRLGGTLAGDDWSAPAWSTGVQPDADGYRTGMAEKEARAGALDYRDQMAAQQYAPLSPTGVPLTPPSTDPMARLSEADYRAKFGAARDRMASKYATVGSLIGPGR